mmetsp:Transcript_8395/g.16713  ORF Transcript_8395/g.16713 Transcript_8395/m.16713 type:complete len:667 (-) Transcript_8395:374-2374(-)
MKLVLAVFLVSWVGLLCLVPKTYVVKPKSTASKYPKVKNKDDNLESARGQNLEFDQFHIDDTEALTQLEGRVSCMPSSWGYSVEQGDKLFPEFHYPRCNSTFDGVKGTLKLDYDTNTVQLECPGNYKGKLVLPKVPSKIVNFKGNDFRKVEYTDKPVKLKGFEEYVLARCEDDALYEIVAAKPRIDQKLLKLAKNSMVEPEPVRILHLVVDSFSRRHFFRKLPKTVELLNSLKANPSYHAYDFKLHNIAGTSSPDNQVWVFSGKPDHSRSRKKPNFINDIWNKLRPYGFVSLLGFDDCNKNFAPVLGLDVTVDHAVNELYCAAHKYADYSDGKYKANKQRCIGEAMPHHYLMEYSLEFMHGYRDANQWVYVHFNAAHEATGQHADTLDLDLADYLHKVLTTYNNTAIFLEGDHGMRYGEWWTSQEASVEYRLPAFFFISPKSVLKYFPRADWALAQNSIRLTSKLDLRRTMFGIAGVPYKAYRHEVNLLSQLIPDSRRCRDVGVSDWLCSCTKFYEIKPKVYRDGSKPSALKLMLHHLAHDGIAEILAELHASRGSHKLCKALTLDKIVYAAGKVSSPAKEMIKLEITVKESPKMKFELSFLIYSYGAYSSRETSRLKPIYYNGKKQFRLLFINRLDKFEGVCEALASSYDIPAKYCLCKNFHEVS